MTLPTADELRARLHRALDAIAVFSTPPIRLGEPGEHGLPVGTPITGDVLFTVERSTPHHVENTISAAAQAFSRWRSTPAPVRGALVGRLGELLTAHKEDLAALV
ncbi:MAG: aldehyde dehydrogenase family protein, partial [Mycobacterium sp.]|nr:aldehyde dehydrogenase family protein [Mycobacterium sp.]